ncbi:MAG: hypothetical protein DWQ37_15280 [Planctomycetota bacterium]|nr:MAG: hypothetical protein DWQ37_15280 [Planctomycetota bacterium]
MVLAFGAALVATAVYLLVDSTPAARRWFVLGVAAGGIVSAIAFCVRGPSAFATLVVNALTANTLKEILASPPGALAVAAGLCLLVGISLGALRNVYLGPRPVGVAALLLLVVWLLLWSLGVAAHGHLHR